MIGVFIFLITRALIHLWRSNRKVKHLIKHPFIPPAGPTIFRYPHQSPQNQSTMTIIIEELDNGFTVTLNPKSSNPLSVIFKHIEQEMEDSYDPVLAKAKHQAQGRNSFIADSKEKVLALVDKLISEHAANE